MNLIDRYIHAVGRQLPRKDRNDIQTEIRSLLEDTLDSYAQKQGREVDEDMVAAVLEEFGSPQEIAQSYTPQPRYLIGPGMYPAFKIGVLIYAGVVTFFYLFTAVLSVRLAPNFFIEFIQTVIRVAPDYLSAMVRVLGTMVIIFAILERVLPEKEPQPEQWDPHDLPEVDDYSELNRMGLVVETAVTIALLILLNFYPQKVGITVIHDSQAVFVPFLGVSYKNFLLALNIWWLLSIALNLFVLSRGMWSRVTRWAEVGVNIVGVFVLYQIFLDDGFFSLNLAWLSELAPSAVEAIETVSPLLLPLSKGIIGLVLIFAVIDIIQQVYRLLFKNPGQLGRATEAAKSS